MQELKQAQNVCPEMASLIADDEKKYERYNEEQRINENSWRLYAYFRTQIL